MAQQSQQMPFDYEVAQNSLKRRQALADALMASSLQPSQGQMISNAAGTFYTGSPLSGVVDALNMVAANRMQKRLDAEQTDVQSRYRNDLSEALQNYETTRTGTPASSNPSSALAPNPDGSPQMVDTPAVPGDPHKAAIEAIVSSFGPLRDIGMSDLKAMGSSALQPKDLLPYAAPSSIPAIASRGVAGFVPKKDVASVGDILYDKGEGNVVQLNGPKPTLGNVNGSVVQISPSTGHYDMLDKRPVTNVSITNGENAFRKRLGEKTADMVDSIRTEKLNALKMQNTVNQLEELNKNPTYSGPTANAAVWLGQLAGTLGMKVDQAKLSNSQEYQGLLSQQISQYLTAGSGVGRSLTDADREVLTKQFPTLMATPEGRVRIIQTLHGLADRSVAYSNAVEENLKNTDPEAYKLYQLAPTNVEYPSSATPGSSAAPMSLEDWYHSRK